MVPPSGVGETVRTMCGWRDDIRRTASMMAFTFWAFSATVVVRMTFWA